MAGQYASPVATSVSGRSGRSKSRARHQREDENRRRDQVGEEQRFGVGPAGAAHERGRTSSTTGRGSACIAA
jgi:hypothetical protein